jgi:hypothetical protein
LAGSKKYDNYKDARDDCNNNNKCAGIQEFNPSWNRDRHEYVLRTEINGIKDKPYSLKNYRCKKIVRF